jgi:hypothetical protein
MEYGGSYMNSFASVKALLNSPAKRFLLLFCIGLTVRLGFSITNGWYLFSFNNEPQKIAHHIVIGNGFSNPFLLPTGPTAHLAPGFPVVLAGIYKLFGEGNTGLFVADTVNAAVSSTVGALLPVAALLCGASPAVGFVAGLFYSLFPPQPYTECKGGWEAAFGALLLISAFIAVRKQMGSGELENRKAFGIGLLIGLSGLFLPTLLVATLGFVTILFLNKVRHRNQLKPFVILALLTFVLVGPWVLRNRIVFGQWFPIRDNLGLELRVSYWDKAKATLAQNIKSGNHGEMHPHASEAEALKVRELGELEYNTRQLKLAREWISQHPGRALQLTLKHVQLFWTNGMRFALLIPFAMWGAVWIRTQDKPSFYLLCAAFILQPLMYYIVQFEPRYRYPIEWAVTLAALIGASAIYQRARVLVQVGRVPNHVGVSVGTETEA